MDPKVEELIGWLNDNQELVMTNKRILGICTMILPDWIKELCPGITWATMAEHDELQIEDNTFYTLLGECEYNRYVINNQYEISYRGISTAICYPTTSLLDNRTFNSVWDVYELLTDLPPPPRPVKYSRDL